MEAKGRYRRRRSVIGPDREGPVEHHAEDVDRPPAPLQHRSSAVTRSSSEPSRTANPVSPRRMVIGSSPGFLQARTRSRSRGASVIQFFARKESNTTDEDCFSEELDEDAEELGPLVCVDPYSHPLTFFRTMRSWKKKARKEVPVAALIGGFKTAELRAQSSLGLSDYPHRRSTFVSTACITSAQNPLRSSFRFSTALCAYEQMPTAGQAYLCGYFYLNKASTTIRRLKVIKGKADTPDVGEFVQLVSKRDDEDVLERPRVLNLRSPITHLGCGADSIALVPSSGGLFFSCADSPAGQLAFGSVNKPASWSGAFFTSLIAGQSIRDIDCGDFHSAAITSRGLVVVWGCNSFLASDNLVISGQCCSAEAHAYVCPPTIVPLPTSVYSQGQVISVSCGQAHTVVVTSVGTYAFGDNRRCQLGVEGIEASEAPILIPESEDWYCRELVCGAYHNVALLGSGKIVTWGLNSYGQCGYSPSKGTISTPIKHSFSEAVIAVSACGSHSAAVTLRGHVYCWGSNCYGESGAAQDVGALWKVSMVSLGAASDIRALTVSCGPYNTAVTTDSGEVYAWGFLCGYNMVTNQFSPRLLPRLSQGGRFVSRVACGTSHIACLVDEDLTTQLSILEAILSGTGAYSSLYLKLTFLSLKVPQFLMGAVQDRAIRSLLLQDPSLPALSAPRAFKQLHCEDVDSRTSTFKVTNISKVPLRVTVIRHQPEEYEGVFSTTFSSQQADLAPAGVFSLKVTVSPKRLLHREMTVLVELQANALGSTPGVSKYFLMLYMTPGETDVMVASELQDSRSSTARSITAMRSFVPNTLLWWMHAKPKPLRTQPRFEVFEAAVLFLDISGFTNLTARLAQLGDAGPDFLSKHLNSYFGTLISVVEGHGGDLVKSAGDAIMFVFGKPWTLFGAMSRKTSPLSTLARSCAQAVNCALQIQTSGLAEYDSKDGFTLTLHVAIGAGELAYMLVGGVNHTWEYVVSGSPLKQLASALTHSDQGEVVVSPECYKFIRSESTATQRGTDWAITSFTPAAEAPQPRKGKRPADSHRAQVSRVRQIEMMAPEQRRAYVDNMRRHHQKKRAKKLSRLDSMPGSASSVTLPRSDSNISVVSESVGEAPEPAPQPSVQKQPGLMRPQLEPSAIDVLRSFVRPAIQFQAETSHSDTLQWVDELRTVTSLFVKLLTVDNADVDALGWEAYCRLIHCAVAVVQRELFNLEGVFCQFLQDDKGTILFAAFGLPPFAHADDANRGVLAALAIHRSLADAGIEACIGVGTGAVFTGVVGNDVRCEYTVLGDSVNMTARIMGVAMKKGLPILCDQVTYERCQHQVSFQVLERVKVKGKDEPVATFAPIERMDIGLGGKMFGRKKEKKILAKAVLQSYEESLHVRNLYLASVNAPVGSRTILIEAPSGMGKNMCASYAVSLCKSLGARICSYECEAINMLKPYHAMRALLNDLLLGSGTADKNQLLNSIKSSLPPEIVNDVALLKPMLDLPYPVRDLRELRGLSGSARAKRTAAVVRSILQLVSCQTMLVFTINDVQWMDPSSIGVMQETASRVGCFVILTAKELSTRARENLDPIISLKGTRKLFLGPLSQKNVLALARDKLGVDELPKEVKAMFLEVNGNPMYCTELALRLKNEPRISVEDRRLQIAGELNVELPKTMKGVISSRIDLLPVHAQTILKVAAAIGQVFTVADLAAVSGDMDEDSDLLRNSLEFLVLQDLLLPLDELRTCFTFRKDIIASVAYGRVMVSRRQELHFRAIEWFSDPENATEDTVSVLAYHYGCALLDMVDPSADVLLKAAEYMLLSAERSKEAFATKEATLFLQHAMDCLNRLPDDHAAKQSHLKSLKLKLMGLPLRDLAEFDLHEKRRGTNVLRKSSFRSTGALPLRSMSRPELSSRDAVEDGTGHGKHNGAVSILRGSKFIRGTYTLDELSGKLKLSGGKRDLEVDARVCAFIDKSKPSVGRFALRIIRRGGTTTDIATTSAQHHRELMLLFQRMSFVSGQDIDEKRFRLAATIFMTEAGKVVRIHSQACHMLRLQAAAVMRQQIRSFMSKSSARLFQKRVAKARKNQDYRIMDKPMVLELNKVKVFASLMDVFMGSRRYMVMLLRRWQPLHPDLAALSDAVLADDEDNDDGDEDDDENVLAEDYSHESEQMEVE